MGGPVASDLFWMSGVDCSCAHTDMMDCAYDDLGTPCSSGMAASVVCGM